MPGTYLSVSLYPNFVFEPHLAMLSNFWLCTQGLLMVGLGGQYRAQRIEPGSVAHKVSALLIDLSHCLSPQMPFLHRHPNRIGRDGPFPRLVTPSGADGISIMNREARRP